MGGLTTKLEKTLLKANCPVELGPCRLRTELLPLVSPLAPSALFLLRQLMLLKEDARDSRPAKDEVDLVRFCCEFGANFKIPPTCSENVLC